MEVHGRGAFLEAAHGNSRNLNLKGLCAMDLRTCKEDGTPLNFDLASDRQLAKDMVLRLEPTWLIGSPPCTPFSKLDVNMNFPKMAPDVVRERLPRVYGTYISRSPFAVVR